MHFKAILILMCIIGYVPTLMADTPSALFERLAQMPGNVQVFCYSQQLPFLLNDMPLGFEKTGYGIVKTPKGLFILPHGTGRIYSYEPVNKRWNRLDSTYYSGYNFGAVNFSMENEIYSFGGYGLWQINGILREYNSLAGEWNAIKTNKYIPWKLRDNGRDNFYYLDTVSGKLFINGLGAQGNQTVIDKQRSEFDKRSFEYFIRNEYLELVARVLDKK